MKQVAVGTGVMPAAMDAAEQAMDENAAIMSDAGSLLRLSAFADGELPAADAEATLARLVAEPALRDAWDEFQLVGDALRSEELPGMGSRHGASGSFAALLAAEPVVLAPRALERQRSIWLRYGLPMGAAAATVLVVSWTVVPQFAAVPLVAKSAPAPAVVAPSASQATVVDTAKLQEYLSAHRDSAASWRSPGLLQPAGLSTSVPAAKIPAR